jgi:hypothetical protein
MKGEEEEEERRDNSESLKRSESQTKSLASRDLCGLSFAKAGGIMLRTDSWQSRRDFMQLSFD